MKPKRLFNEIEKRTVLYLYEYGHSDEEVAQCFGEETISFIKRCNYNGLSLVIKSKKEMSDALVERALFKSACGYTTIEKQAEKKGGIVVAQRLIEKEVAPNVTAIMMWLINRTRMTKKWQNIFAKALNGGDENGTVNIVNIFQGLKEVTKGLDGDNLTRLITALESLADKQSALPKAKKTEALDAQTTEVGNTEDPGADSSGEDR